MKDILILLLVVVWGSLNAQKVVSTNDSKQVYYSIENGIQGQIGLNEWDIAIEPQGDYAIRINEASGTKVWTNTEDIRDNCTLTLNCTGLQNYTPIFYDTTGMASQTNNWIELHNSYDDWKMGALNQQKPSFSTDIVGYGWGGYRAFSTSPAHAIIGYRIFILQLRNGEYKQFFVRKSLTESFDYAYANLDGSELKEVSIKRTDYENKMFSYRSLIQHQTFNPEPVESQWDLMFTPFPAEKAIGNTTNFPGVLHNINRTSSKSESDSVCFVPMNYSENIQTIGYNWWNSTSNKIRSNTSFFIRKENGATYFYKQTAYDDKGIYSFIIDSYNTDSLRAQNIAQNENCVNCEDGSISVIPYGGICEYSIEWNHGSNKFDLSNLSPGTYLYSLRDNNGNLYQDSVTILPYQCTISILETKTKKLSCYGSNDGEITLIIDGAKDDYSVEWSNGKYGTSIDSLNSGWQHFVLTENTGCILTDSILIQSADSIFAQISTTDESCNECENGSIFVDPLGGQSPYTIVWEDDATLSDFERHNLAPGNYSAIITDSNGCTKTIASKIQKLGCKLVTGRKDIVNPKCFGDKTGSIFIDAVGNIGALMYKWSTGETSKTITDLAAGTYILILEDEAGCKDSSSYILTDPTQISNSFDLQEATCESCEDAQIFSQPSGGTPPYSFLWNTGDQNRYVDSLSNGIYTVLITDKNGCESSFTYDYKNTVGLTNTIEESIVVYPNPVNSILYISGANDLEISIVSIDGKLMFAKKDSTTLCTIPTDTWPKGTYVIQLKSKKDIFHHRIMVTH